MAQEKIHQLQRELNLKHKTKNLEINTTEKPSEQAADVLDAFVQTDFNFNSNDQSCQTIGKLQVIGKILKVKPVSR